MLLTGIVIGLAIGYFCLSGKFSRKSEYYRKVLADLFVAGRIKQLAKEQSIDLAEEFEDYKSFCKKREMLSYSLDDAIELELQDQVGNKKSKDKKSEDKKSKK